MGWRNTGWCDERRYHVWDGVTLGGVMNVDITYGMAVSLGGVMNVDITYGMAYHWVVG